MSLSFSYIIENEPIKLYLYNQPCQCVFLNPPEW